MLTRLNFLRAIISSVLSTPLLLKAGAARPLQNGGVRTASANSTSIDLARLLSCLAQVETGDNPRAVGRHGESSRYQISRVVWYQYYPDRSFFDCHGILAEECAWRHINWLLKHIHTRSPYWLAYAWRAGLKTANGPITFPTHDRYANRVENLYYNVTFCPKPISLNP